MKVGSGKMEAIKALIECDMPYTLHFGKDVDDTIGTSIDDEGYVGCCKVVDIAADIQRRLDERNEQNQTQKTTIEGLLETNTNLSMAVHELKSTIKYLQQEIEGRKESFKVQEGNYNKIIDKRDETIQEHKRKLDGVSAAFDDQNSAIEGIEAELSVRRKDSGVLMSVVEIIMDESVDNSKAAWLITKVVEDYIDPPEGQIDTPIDEPNEITVKIAWLELP